jgi:hypothetical protein
LPKAPGGRTRRRRAGARANRGAQGRGEGALLYPSWQRFGDGSTTPCVLNAMAKHGTGPYSTLMAHWCVCACNKRGALEVLQRLQTQQKEAG